MPEPVSINELANIELDRRYKQSAGNMLLQIHAITSTPQSAMQRALKELDDEADRLVDNDERMSADNATLQKALNENEQSLEAASRLVQANDNAIQEAGQALAITAVTAKVFSAISHELARNGIDPLSSQAISVYKKATIDMGITWNTPNALDFATNYVDTTEWLYKMEGWGSGYSELTRTTILSGVKQGWGPKYTASQMRKHAENIPTHAAENLTRTLQLTSYRDASAAMETANGQFIEGKIRISALKQTSCLSCIALHGTELQPGARVDDHYRGRCTEFYQVVGGPRFPSRMQADSTPGNRRFVKYQSGPEWFSSLPESRQKAQASFAKSPAKWRAFKDGVPLSEFVGEHIDPVFGLQVVENSLVKAIGDKAEGYYTVNQ